MSESLSLPGFPAPVPAASAEALEPLLPSQRRIHTAARQHVELIARSLDETVPDDHPARMIWDLVGRLDLEDFFVSIRARLDGPGRPASDPQVLLALWMFATIEGVGSARRLARLCQEHDAYRWLRGGVPVNYHQLSDFRSGHRAALDGLLTQTIAVLLHQDLVTLKTVAQDGIRVRASAGGSSFRRRATLERCQAEAAAQVQRVGQEAERPDLLVSRREQAARKRAARERQARLDAAMAELPAVEAAKERQRKRKGKKAGARVSAARISTTDPEARVMKMADGGFRPAYNVQEVTDGASRAILAVQVTNAGSDGGLAAPVETHVRERCGRDPETYLMDGGLVDLDDITTLTERGITVYAPVPEPTSPESGRTKGDPRPEDTPAVAAWRARMVTETGQTGYQQRGAVVEWSHAQWRTRCGLQQFRVRGIEKVTSVMLLIAVTHNLLQWVRLGA